MDRPSPALVMPCAGAHLPCTLDRLAGILRFEPMQKILPDLDFLHSQPVGTSQVTALKGSKGEPNGGDGADFVLLKLSHTVFPESTVAQKGMCR